jgi:hypothetical protein
VHTRTVVYEQRGSQDELLDQQNQNYSTRIWSALDVSKARPQLNEA